MSDSPTRVAILAFGMEHCRRGVEAHARMLFEKLKVEPSIDVRLIKGSGSSDNREHVLSVPKRNTWLNRGLGRLRGYNVYWEQVFFLIRLYFYMSREHRHIDTLYTQEYVHMVGLGRLKKMMGWKFNLVYCEGFVSQHDTRVRYADRLQEINKDNYDNIRTPARGKGVPVQLIPHFFDPIWEDEDLDTRELKSIVEFKNNRKMLLYVGPTELAEKNFIRIEESATELPQDWSILICGDANPERLAKLNRRQNNRVKSVYVSHALMQRIYPLADLFVLPSIHEAFGIATIEAMGHGIPVLLHKNEHSLWLCNDEEQCIDMTKKNAVSSFIRAVHDFNEFKSTKSEQNQNYFLRTFTWEELRMDYLRILRK